MITLEEFEDRLVAGVDKIHNQHVYQAIRPQTLHVIEMHIVGLLDELARDLMCYGSRDKILIKVGADAGTIIVDFLDPSKPFYEIRYDGSINMDNITGYKKFHHVKDMYYKLIGLKQNVIPKP